MMFPGCGEAPANDNQKTGKYPTMIPFELRFEMFDNGYNPDDQIDLEEFEKDLFELDDDFS